METNIDSVRKPSSENILTSQNTYTLFFVHVITEINFSIWRKRIWGNSKLMLVRLRWMGVCVLELKPAGGGSRLGAGG